MNRETASRRAADAKRRKEKPWRQWYATPAWRIRRAEQLHRVPWCEPCKRQGRSRAATVANHKIPHRGDRALFDKGELESCCKNCHDQAIQTEERLGFERVLDDDGWPTDPAHPFNRQGPQ